MAKKNTDVYVLEETIEAMEIADYIKKGFLYHIHEKNITIKNDNDLEKEYKKFMEGK